MGALDCVTSGDRIKGTESTEVFTIPLEADRTSSISCLDVQRRDLESQFSKADSSSFKHSTWWTIGIDVPLIIAVALTIGLFELGVIPSHRAGFYCNDPALAHRFTGDTASMAFVMVSVLLLPLAVIFAAELIFLDPDFLRRSRANQAIRNTLWLCRIYAYGFIFNLAIVELMKGIAGSPRPTFFDICEPDTAKTCNGSEFVPTFQCTSTKFSSWFQADASHSFPSGHTSLSVYCGLFIAWYLQQRAFDWRHRSVFAVPVLQMTCLAYAAFCSLTRITDHRHHWWDVLAGFGVGIVSLFYAVIVLCDNFSFVRSQPSSELTCHDSQQSRTLLYDGRPVLVT